MFRHNRLTIKKRDAPFFLHKNLAGTKVEKQGQSENNLQIKSSLKMAEERFFFAR